MFRQATLGSSGALTPLVVRRNPFSVYRRPWSLASIWHYAFPHWGLSRDVNVWRMRNLPHVLAGVWRLWIGSVLKLPMLGSALFIRVRRGGNYGWEEYGIASFRVVTTAGVNFLASAFDNTVEPEILKYHGYGTGGGAEAIGDTALTTELNTEYNPNGTRPTGSQAHATNTYTTVGTLTPDTGSPAVTEHGVFSQAATGGTLWDRSLFAAVNLVAANGDSLQTTYVLTLTAGG